MTGEVVITRPHFAARSQEACVTSGTLPVPLPPCTPCRPASRELAENGILWHGARTQKHKRRFVDQTDLIIAHMGLPS